MRSFSEVHPELLSEWSPENKWRPDRISYGSNKLVVWNGSCGHTWTASVKNRGNHHGCPYCSGNRVLVGFNDFESVHPEIAKEWSERNLPATPRQFTARSDKPFWWKCSECAIELRIDGKLVIGFQSFYIGSRQSDLFVSGRVGVGFTNVKDGCYEIPVV